MYSSVASSPGSCVVQCLCRSCACCVPVTCCCTSCVWSDVYSSSQRLLLLLCMSMYLSGNVSTNSWTIHEYTNVRCFYVLSCVFVIKICRPSAIFLHYRYLSTTTLYIDCSQGLTVAPHHSASTCILMAFLYVPSTAARLTHKVTLTLYINNVFHKTIYRQCSLPGSTVAPHHSACILLYISVPVLLFCGRVLFQTYN